MANSKTTIWKNLVGNYRWPPRQEKRDISKLFHYTKIPREKRKQREKHYGKWHERSPPAPHTILLSSSSSANASQRLPLASASAWRWRQHKNGWQNCIACGEYIRRGTSSTSASAVAARQEERGDDGDAMRALEDRSRDALGGCHPCAASPPAVEARGDRRPPPPPPRDPPVSSSLSPRRHCHRVGHRCQCVPQRLP